LNPDAAGQRPIDKTGERPVRKLAWLAAAAAPTLLATSMPAAAQNATLYGVVDAFVEFGKAGTRQTRLQSGGANSSRLGFRGTEDLGGGMNAVFVLEHGFVADTGSAASSVFWNRQTYVGVNNKSWGSVTLGRQYTPVLETQDRNDPAINTTGYGSAYNSGVMRTFSRADNSVRYQSPSFGGVTVTGMVGLGENATGGNHLAAANVRYAGGPVNVEVAYGVQDAGNPQQEDKSIGVVAGTWTLGNIKLMGALQRTRNDSRAVNVKDDRNEFMLGGVWQLGLSRLHAAYGQGKVRDVNDSTARHYSLAYAYDLSKRTAVYSVYQVVDNPKNLAYRTSGFTFDATLAGLPAQAGMKASALAFGLRHRF
jgi:predicted porin